MGTLSKLHVLTHYGYGRSTVPFADRFQSYINNHNYWGDYERKHGSDWERFRAYREKEVRADYKRSWRIARRLQKIYREYILDILDTAEKMGNDEVLIHVGYEGDEIYERVDWPNLKPIEHEQVARLFKEDRINLMPEFPYPIPLTKGFVLQQLQRILGQRFFMAQESVREIDLKSHGWHIDQNATACFFYGELWQACLWNDVGHFGTRVRDTINLDLSNFRGDYYWYAQQEKGRVLTPQEFYEKEMGRIEKETARVIGPKSMADRSSIRG